jgi:hypothetical protein
VTRLGSTTHLLFAASFKNKLASTSDKEMRILQFGPRADLAVALETGRIAVAALTLRTAIRFLDRGWPLFVDLTKTNFCLSAVMCHQQPAFLKEQPARWSAF